MAWLIIFWTLKKIFYDTYYTFCINEYKWEELPHVLGQGTHAWGAMAKRSSSHLRSGEAAERSYPASKVRGGGQECQAATAQEQPRGATPHLRPRAAAGRSNPTSKEWWLRLEELFHIQCQEGWRYLLSKVRSSGCALLEQLWRDTPRPR